MTDLENALDLLQQTFNHWAGRDLTTATPSELADLGAELDALGNLGCAIRLLEKVSSEQTTTKQETDPMETHYVLVTHEGLAITEVVQAHTWEEACTKAIAHYEDQPSMFPTTARIMTASEVAEYKAKVEA